MWKGSAKVYRDDIISKLNENRIVAILRKIDSKKTPEVVEALIAGGIKCFEITADTEGAFESLKFLRDNFKDQILIGAGTILEPITCRIAILAGADFIVTPTLSVETIRMSNLYGKPCIPGAMNPTQILAAYENGASMVKVFPAASLGASYFREIRGPLSHIPLMATGGINLDNIEEFQKAGVRMFGVGSSLTDKEAIENDDYRKLQAVALQFVEKVSDRI